jgi:nucleoside-diphosphate-sugar epimerase
MDLANQKILVTGADGFIGSHMVEGLLAKGCQVRAFMFYNSFNTHLLFAKTLNFKTSIKEDRNGHRRV